MSISLNHTLNQSPSIQQTLHDDSSMPALEDLALEQDNALLIPIKMEYKSEIEPALIGKIEKTFVIGNYVECMNYIEIALKEDSNNQYVLFRKMEILKAQEQYVKAMTIAQFLKQQYDNPFAHISYLECYILSKQYAYETERQAAWDFLQGIEQQYPANSTILTCKAILLFFNNKNDEAMDILNSVVSRTSFNYELALEYRLRIKSDQIIKTLQIKSELENRPKDRKTEQRIETLNIVIISKYKQLDLCRDQMLQFHCNNITALRLKAQNLQHLGETFYELDTLNKLLTLNPALPRIYYRRHELVFAPQDSTKQMEFFQWAEEEVSRTWTRAGVFSDPNSNSP